MAFTVFSFALFEREVGVGFRGAACFGWGEVNTGERGAVQAETSGGKLSGGNSRDGGGIPAGG
ncbi:hypothetical protein CSB20_12275 [bacterium DOLZORAL124_64_63]|nr:MAG: hypothetical protein CSB20_12275 [bacterium DOLZORAL124_64_63]